MCAGCCRYLIDHHILKVPLIGEWLVKIFNVEKGGTIIKFLCWFYRKELEKCANDWQEEYKDSIK